MAAFRKLLKTTKNKINRSGSAKSKKKNRTQEEEEDEDFERRKQQWQEDLEEMSEFLVLKSTEEQRAEGVENPVDTAYIDDREGMPILKVVFDVSQFRPEEVHLDATDEQLVLVARGTDDTRECSIFRKTMVRKLDLPEHVETKMMHCDLSPDGILTIEMPFHLPAQRRPVGPSVVPIVTDDDGRRKIRFSVHIGPDFTTDDVQVEVTEGRQLQVTAFYDAEIGHYGSQVTKRRVERNFRLPDNVKVDTVEYTLSADGYLKFEILLVHEKTYKCAVVTEELVGENPTTPEIEIQNKDDCEDGEEQVDDDQQEDNQEFQQQQQQEEENDA